MEGDFCGKGVDVHDPPTSAGVPRSRIVLDEIEADANHQVGFVEPSQLVVPGQHTDRQEVHGGRPRHRPFPHERMSDGDPQILGEETQFLGGPAPDHAVPGEHEWPVRLLNQVGGFLQTGSIGRWTPDAFDWKRFGVRARLFIGDVFGQLDVRRTGLLRLGQLERLPDDLWNRVRALDPCIPLGDWVKEAQDVDELMRFPMDPRQIGLCGDRDERCSIEERVGHARDEVRRTGSQRRNADARMGREPSLDIRHERGGLFVAREDEADGAFAKRVHQIQVFLPRNPEDETDPLVLQARDQ